MGEGKGIRRLLVHRRNHRQRAKTQICHSCHAKLVFLYQFFALEYLVHSKVV